MSVAFYCSCSFRESISDQLDEVAKIHFHYFHNVKSIGPQELEEPRAACFGKNFSLEGVLGSGRSGVNGDDPAVFVQGWRSEISTSPAALHRESCVYDQGMNLVPLSWISDLFHTVGAAAAKHSSFYLKTPGL